MKKLSVHLKDLRTSLDLSQEAMGAQGFVSAPGWVKLENGQRDPSEKLIEALAGFIVGERVKRKEVFKKDADARTRELKEELLTLKYASSKSAFLRSAVEAYATRLPNYDALRIHEPRVVERGRPRSKKRAAANPATATN